MRQIPPCEELPRTRKEASQQGLRYFFPDKPCPEGHNVQWSVSGRCVECNRIHVRAWREAHPDRVRDMNNDYNSRNREMRKEYAREWRKTEAALARRKARRIKILPKLQEQARNRYARNAEAEALKARERRAANPEKFRNADRERRTANPEKQQIKDATRRSRQVNATGSYSADDIIRIKNMQKDKCACCRKALRGRGEVDHIVALSRGGTNWPNNLQLLCRPCNISKGARDAIHFMRLRGKLL